MTVRRVVYDTLRCTACKTCEMQCSVSHSRSGELLDALFESPPPLPRLSVAWTPGVNVPVKCAHCETAPCLLGCPVGAIRRDRPTDAVLVDDTRCIGCFSCVLVCPYGAIRLSHDRKRVHKCDGCVDWIAESREPACSASCPTGALAFREVEEVAREKTAATAAREAAALRRGKDLEGAVPSPMETILKMREEMARG